MGAIHVLLITDRPAVQTFFLSLGKSNHNQHHDHNPKSFPISHFNHFQISEEVAPLFPKSHGQSDPQAQKPERLTIALNAAVTTAITASTLAVVDVMPNPATAIQACQLIHARQSLLPIAALFCCPYSAEPRDVQALVAAGASSLLDLQGTDEEMSRALLAMARGDLAISLQMSGIHRLALNRMLPPRELKVSEEMDDKVISERPSIQPHSSDAMSTIDNRLIELIALGLSNQEIGRQLNISPHTVKHHVEHLRAVVGAKNRIELAAWAGQQGFYRFEPSLGNSLVHSSNPSVHMP